jgi:hypothetical protein
MMHNFRQDMPAYIYWGSAEGFHESDRTILPAFIAAGIAVGDLNEDGLPDIVLANQGCERGFDVRFGAMINYEESFIYWGHPTGFDVTHRSSLPTISAADVAIGDFNGDRHLDLAFVNDLHEEQSVYVYWGDGSGKFSASARQVISLGGSAADPKHRAIELNTAIARDLNGDGISDLVVGSSTNVVAFLGQKSGLSTTRWTELPADNCHAVEAADLNGDGRVDLVVANAGVESHPPKSVVYWGTEQGYRAEQATTLPTRSAMSVKAADLNSDGFPDLLFGNVNTSEAVPAQIFWGGPDGFAEDRRKELTAFSAIGVGVADLDRDGHPDVVLMNHLSGSGEGAMPTSIFWGSKSHRYSAALSTQLQPGGYMMYKTADLDDDGWPDLVVVTAGRPWVWWGGPDGFDAKRRTELPITSQPGGNNVAGLGVADLDRDGHLDVVCVGRLNTDPKEGGPRAFIVYGGADRFATARAEMFRLPGGSGTAGALSLTIVDLNQDGWLDMIFPMIDLGLTEIRWGGPKGFVDARTTTVDSNGASFAGVADLDGDGWLDVIFPSGMIAKRRPDQPVIGGAGLKGTTRNSFAYIYWGNAAGEFKEHTEVETYNSLDVTVADLNRDGHLDLAFSSYMSDTTRELPAFVYWGDGTRNFSEKRRTLLDAASSASMDALDLNHDGWLDLIVTNHQKNFSHSSGSNIYWGGPQGFSIARRVNLPTIGSHLDAMVDAGNLRDRRYAWDYVSSPIEAVKDMAFSQLSWKADTSLGTGVKFQVRSAASKEGLAAAKWSGPEGADSYYMTPGSKLVGIPSTHRWLNYRAVLTSPDGGNSAVLKQVEIGCTRP